MKIFLNFLYLACILNDIVSAIPSTTPLPRPRFAPRQLSKTAQLINFVNSGYNVQEREFIGNGYNHLGPYKRNNLATEGTTMGIDAINPWFQTMWDIIQTKYETDEDYQKKLRNAIRYQVIDNPEVLDEYHKNLDQKHDTLSSSLDYETSSSGESSGRRGKTKKLSTVRRNIGGYKMIEPMEIKDDPEEMPKASANTKVSFYPSFPDDDESTFHNDYNHEKYPKNKELLNAIKIRNEFENDPEVWHSTPHIQPWVKEDTKMEDFRQSSDSANRDAELQIREIKEDDWNKEAKSITGEIYDNLYKKAHFDAQDDLNSKEELTFHDKYDWEKDDINDPPKDKSSQKDSWDKKDKFRNDDVNYKYEKSSKRDTGKVVGKHGDWKDEGYGWKFENVWDKDKTTPRENAWDVQEKKKNKQRDWDEPNSYQQKEDHRSKKTDEYESKRPDWDKKIYDDDSKKKIDKNYNRNKDDDRDTKGKGKKDNEWDNKDDWNKKSDDWNKKDSDGTKKNNDWDKADNNWDKKDEWNKKDDWNKKDNDRNHKTNDWDKKDDWNKKDNWNKKDDWNKKDNERYHKKNDWEKKDDWNKKDNNWSKKETGRNKKDDDWDKKENKNDDYDKKKKDDDWNRKVDDSNEKGKYGSKKDNEWDKRESDKNDWDKKDNGWNKKDNNRQKKENDWNKKPNKWDDNDNSWNKNNNDWNRKENNEDTAVIRKDKDDWDKITKYTTKNSHWNKEDNLRDGLKQKGDGKANEWDKVGVEKTDDWGNKKGKDKVKSFESRDKSFERPKKKKDSNVWDNYVPKIADYYKPKKAKSFESYERPRNKHAVPAFIAYGRTPIPFVGKKRIYADK